LRRTAKEESSWTALSFGSTNRRLGPATPDT
jgi:hypothetical protein